MLTLCTQPLTHYWPEFQLPQLHDTNLWFFMEQNPRTQPRVKGGGGQRQGIGARGWERKWGTMYFRKTRRRWRKKKDDLILYWGNFFWSAQRSLNEGAIRAGCMDLVCASKSGIQCVPLKDTEEEWRYSYREITRIDVGCRRTNLDS